MNYKFTSVIIRLVLLMPFCIVSLFAQWPSAREILSRPDHELAQFLEETIELRFPKERSDHLTMLLLNRSNLSVPLILRRLETELNSQIPSEGFVNAAVEMISYAGNEDALAAVGRLMTINASEFGTYVGRTLDNALHHRNPFTVAYAGIEAGGNQVAERVGIWADSAIGSERMQRLWADALADRNSQTFGDAEWLRDPLVARLSRQPEGLRERMMSLTAEARQSRQRRQQR